MSTLDEANSDLSKLTKLIYDGIDDFQSKYPKLEVDDLSIDTMQTVGISSKMQTRVVAVRLHVSLV